MKVGILTFHRANNSGAVLQCYALQEAIRSLGHEASVIDYQQPSIEKFYSVKTKLKILFSRAFRSVRPLRSMVLRVNFNAFRDRNLNICGVDADVRFPECDVYVIGSDQVWSEQCTMEFDDVYFGYFDRTPQSRVVGYSVSCPLSSIDKLGTMRLKKALLNFSAISFREAALRDYIQKKIGFKGYVTTDPVLLLPRERWCQLTKPFNKRRVLVFIFKYRLTSDDWVRIKMKSEEMARRLDAEVYDMSKGALSPGQFLSEIRNAEYVITNSFHTVAFSLIFQKQFAAVVSGDGLDTRYSDLLKSVGLGNLLMTPSSLTYVEIGNYDKVNENLETLRNASLNYLKNSIK